MKKIFLAVMFLASAISSYADWKIEKSKNFAGEDETFLVAKTLGDGTELWIDLQQKFVVIRNNKRIFKKVNGLKLDDAYYDVTGYANGDAYEYAVFCQYSLNSQCYKNIFSAKKIAVNVEYFRTGERVSIFNVNGTSETQEKYYRDDCEVKTNQLIAEKRNRYRNIPSAIELSLEEWLKQNCSK